MESVQLFICSVRILRDGCQPGFSTGYPMLSSVALIIRTKVTYISRLQVSGCLQLSLFPLSVGTCSFAYQLDISLLRKVVTIFLRFMKHFCGIYLF